MSLTIAASLAASTALHSAKPKISPKVSPPASQQIAQSEPRRQSTIKLTKDSPNCMLTGNPYEQIDSFFGKDPFSYTLECFEPKNDVVISAHVNENHRISSIGALNLNYNDPNKYCNVDIKSIGKIYNARPVPPNAARSNHWMDFVRSPISLDFWQSMNINGYHSLPPEGLQAKISCGLPYGNY